MNIPSVDLNQLALHQLEHHKKCPFVRCTARFDLKRIKVHLYSKHNVRWYADGEARIAGSQELFYQKYNLGQEN